MSIEYDEHILQAVARLIKKLMLRAKRNDDRVSIMYIETLIKLFDAINGGKNDKRVG